MIEQRTKSTSASQTACALLLALASACGDTAADSSNSADGGSAGGAGTDGAAGTGADGGIQVEGDGGSGLVDSGQVDPGTITPSGGTLREGVCLPGNNPTFESLGSKVKVLAEKSALFFGPVAHSTGVYYSIEDDGLYRIPPGSDTPELVVATPGKRYTPWSEGDLLYYRISDVTGTDPVEYIESIPFSDLTATPTKVIQDPPRDYVLDDTYLYAVDHDTYELYREPRAGGAREVLMTNTTAENLQIANGYLYFIYSGDYISRIPLTGGADEGVVSANGFDISSYHLTNDGVYWTDYYALYYTAFADGKKKQAILGGDTYFMKVVGDRVFWMNDSFPNMSVGWTKLDASDCAFVLASNIEANGFAVADDGLYVTTFSVDNMIYRIPLE